MDYWEKQRLYEELRRLRQRLEQPRSFYDEHESDCIEIWDAFEGLQSDVKELQLVVAKLAELNGLRIATKKEV